MVSTLLLSVLCSLGANPAPAAARLEFKDAATFEGRTIAQYRAIEFRDTPIRPLPGDFKAAGGARYGLVPVGPKPETALAIVWCPKAPGGPELWLDANGDGRLVASERHVMRGPVLEVAATITVSLEPKPLRVTRTLIFRRSILGDGLRYAVRGFAEGMLALGAARHRVLLVDGNADGCFDSVGQDRVWLDLDGSGTFDPLLEQFPLGKPIVADGETWVVRSDPLASAVRASMRSASQGKLRLSLPQHVRSGANGSAELISDLGELVLMEGFDRPAAVPVGQYRVSWLKLEMADASGQRWTYSFHQDKVKNHSVRTGEETKIEVLDKLAMNVDSDRFAVQENPKPGETVVVAPRLVADECLYLSACTIGAEGKVRAAEGSAEVYLLSLDGKIISRGITGFS